LTIYRPRFGERLSGSYGGTSAVLQGDITGYLVVATVRFQ